VSEWEREITINAETRYQLWRVAAMSLHIEKRKWEWTNAKWINAELFNE
jgi:hypothetical protein